MNFDIANLDDLLAMNTLENKSMISGLRLKTQHSIKLLVLAETATAL